MTPEAHHQNIPGELAKDRDGVLSRPARQPMTCRYNNYIETMSIRFSALRSAYV